MGRKKSKLFHVYYRENGAVWVWWADGKGGKVRKRVYNDSGIGLTKNSPELEQEEHSGKTYYRWCDTPTSKGSGVEEEVGALRLGELTALYVESQGSWWDADTIEAYILFLDLLQEFFGVQCPVASVTHDRAIKFMKKLRKERIGSGATDRKYLGFYKSLFRYAVEIGHLSVNPFQTIRSAYKKRNKPIKNAFTPDEVNAIIQASKHVAPWFTPALIIAAVTGVHQCELIHLRVFDVHIDVTTPYLDVRDEIAKGDSGRTFGLSQSLAELLRRHINGRDKNEFLFLSDSGKKIPTNHFNQSTEGGRIKRTWLKILEVANVAPRRFNCLRQGVDTNLTSRAGVHSAEAAKFVGHTENVSVAHYQDRPLDVTAKLVDKMCELYDIDFDDERGGYDDSTAKTQDIYPRSETLGLVG